MKANWNVWAKRACVTFVASAVALPIWNLVIDPYQVFGTEVIKRDSLDPNERYIKVAHLLKTIGRYDSFIIGSSTAAAYRVQSLNTQYPGSSFYNLGMLAGTAGDALAALKAYKDAGGQIKHVVYGIDPFTFHEAQRTGPGYWKHPAITGEASGALMLKYLFVPSVKNGLLKLTSLLSTDPDIEFDFEGSGEYHLTKYDRWIEKNHAEFIEKKFGKLGRSSTAVIWNKDRIQEFSDLAQWLQDNQVEATYFFNPMHPIAIHAYGEETLKQWQALLQRSTSLSILDFSHLEHSKADWNFYDEKHFRDVLAQQVLQRL